MKGHASDYTAKTIDAKEFTRKYPQPVVLDFQPETFSLLEDPEDLRRWERDLAQHVGISSALDKRIAEDLVANGGTCCESGSTNDCDVD